jgi:serine/threonine-protein kinase
MMADDTRADRDRMGTSNDATREEVRGRRATASFLASGEVCASDGDGRIVPAIDDAAAIPSEVLAPGRKVGRYQVVRLVGQGGMGAVYEAHDARLNRTVALKILASSLKGKRKAAKRFSIEAQAAARLVHPNVVGIFDFDVECETPYMAMEFLHGETLASVITRGRLAVERLADIMLAVCAGVHAAHEAGIVHRDLKPSNIFLCPDWKGNETARVLDFGISKVGGVSSSGLTQTGDIIGTSQYLSPEQAAGARNVSPFSDQYSLGVVMYECVTQRTPQQGQPLYRLLRNVSNGEHALPHLLRPDLPAGFESIIETAMSVRPKDRFPSVYELGQALCPFASIEGRHQFDDFYNRTDSSSTVSAAPSETGGSRLAPSTAATRRLPAEQPHTWQHRTTRTSVRPAGHARPVPSRSQLRKPLFVLSIFVLAAIAALLTVGFSR